MGGPQGALLPRQLLLLPPCDCHARNEQDLPSPNVQAAEARTQHAALLAFLSSHAVLWLQPPQAAQAAAAQPLPHATQLLSQLRLLQQLKSALLPAALRLLELSPEEASAVTPGLCVPQLLVLAQVQQPAAAPVEATGAAGAAIAAETAAPPAEQLAAAAEAAERQLRLLLKLCRPLQPEGSARALCSLPTAGPLVLALPEHLGSGGSQEQLVADALADLGLAGQQAPPAKPLPAATVAAALAQQRSAVAAMAAGAASPPSVQGWLHAVRGLSAVLKAAALRAAGSGSAADVEVPPEASAAVAWQEACSDGVQQFSQASCKRAAALAAEAYRRNTPALLPAAGHAAALQAALRLYRSLARGPAAAGGAAALQQQLSDYWRDGHQQCEAVSFLGAARRTWRMRWQAARAVDAEAWGTALLLLTTNACCRSLAHSRPLWLPLS